MLQFVVGVASSATVLAPFLGRVGGTSGRYIAIVCLLITLVLALCEMKRWARPTKRATLFSACAVLLLVFIILAASPPQWEYATNIHNWISAPVTYYRAKLVVILVNAIPALAVVFAAALFSRNLTLNYSRGALVGFVVIGAIAAARLISDSKYIFTDDLDLAWSYLADRNRGYSVVGHGIIYAVAALAPLGFVTDDWRRNSLIAVICAFFFTCIFVVNQRADVVFTATILIAACVWAIIFNIRRTAKIRILPTFAIAAGIFIFGVLNPAHTIYWSELMGGIGSQAVESRIAAASDALDGGQEADSKDAARLSTENGDPRASGLGAVALRNPKLLYPHNVALEIWAEVGVIATLLFMFMMVGSAYYAAQFRNLRRAQVALGLGSVLCMILLHHMKAGDLSSLGLLYWGMWTVWSFPRRSESGATGISAAS
ncbi:MAG: hypothetical protein IKE42_31070 [Aquamicrobium sp.]|nr:hypothetical protein [Mesorhizobium sp. Pch-S]MBR2692321.1 hypothetical protein [Aquamicrobium sp.]